MGSARRFATGLPKRPPTLARVLGWRWAAPWVTAVEHAYQRSDLIKRRRPLADAWADFLARPLLVREVVPLRK
jgi:hypothetical protein